MEQEFTIRSKINVKPKRGTYIFKILLNICLAATMAAGIIKIIFEGVDIATLGTMALAVIIVSAYKKRPSVNEHYEFALVNAVINNAEIKLLYHQVEAHKDVDIKVVIPTSQITALEFSDQLCCLHICGKILCESVGSTANTEEYTEHFLYLERENEREIISAFQQATGVSVRYMDR